MDKAITNTMMLGGNLAYNSFLSLNGQLNISTIAVTTTKKAQIAIIETIIVTKTFIAYLHFYCNGVIIPPPSL